MRRSHYSTGWRFVRGGLAVLALAFGGALFGAAGCERRIEEPAQAYPLSPASTARSDGSVGRDGGERGSSSRSGCVRPSPAQAKRSTPPSPDPRCPKDPEVPPKLRMGKVTFSEAKGSSVDVEVADNDRTRTRGLMFRKAMANDHGMIFVFEEKDIHSFWMHNTCIPLDMLYLDEDGVIVGIEENTPTMSDETFDVGCPSKYVLEVNAGYTRAHGVLAGQRVKLEGI
jgi:uncharacterized protein